MSSPLEICFIQHLFDIDSVEYLAKEGIDEEVLPTPELRLVYQYALEYFFQSRRTSPLNDMALKTYEISTGRSMADMLDDLEVPYIGDPELSIADVVFKLKANYAHMKVATFNRDFATAMADADLDQRISVASAGATRLIQLVNTLESRRNKVDARTSVDEALANYEYRVAHKDDVDGISFGLPEIDNHTLYIHPGELAVVGAYAKVGKAQPVDELIATPVGWIPMGSLGVGDRVLGSNGRPITILQVHPQGVVPIYLVTCSDGSKTRCCGDHLWKIRGSCQDRSVWHVLTTQDIKRDLENGRSRFTYLPSMSGPAVFDPQPILPIDPYLLGFLLGDGGLTIGVTFTCTDDDFADRRSDLERSLPLGVEIRKIPSARYGYQISKTTGRNNVLKDQLKNIGVFGYKSEHKSIPFGYRMSSVKNRISLLQGLLDTDGGMEQKCVTYSSSSRLMAKQVQEIVRSLGGTASMRGKKTTHLRSYVLRIKLPVELGCPFRLKRKADLWYKRRNFTQNRPPVRRIISIELVGEMEAQCITVDAPDSLYLTSDYIVTHNSFWQIYTALNEWRRGRAVALFSLENSIDMTMDRLCCSATSVDANKWMRGECNEAELSRVEDFRKLLVESSTPLYILQPPSGARTAEAMVRQAQVLECDSLLIDQLTFMEHSNPGRKPRNEVVRDIMHSLKVSISANGDPLPCLLTHQMNRDGKKEADKIGYHKMEHFAESSEVERTADMAFSMYQSDEARKMDMVLFQILAGRRFDLKWWNLFWSVAIGACRVRNEQPMFQ